MTNNLLITENIIKDKIYFIRNQHVMLDYDLAKIYGYTTSKFNEQVKNNIKKFDNDFMFQLTDDEYKNLISKNRISSWGGRRKPPYAFTESGIYMLMTVLKGEVAIEQSKTLIRIFRNMKDFLLNNNFLNQNYINNMVLKHDEEILLIKEEFSNDIKLLHEAFNKYEKEKLVNKIFYIGQIYDAYSCILDIFNKSDKEIVIIDGYADKIVLDIISKMNKKVILITKYNNVLKQIDIDKYNEQYHNLKVYYTNDFHDRFIILDRKIIYHLGSSINHIGNKISAINKIEDKNIIDFLTNKIKKY